MRLAVIEFNDSHTELLPSYYQLLSSQHELHFYVNHKTCSELLSQFKNASCTKMKKSKLSFVDGFKLALKLKRDKITHCILNTAEGKHSRSFCFFSCLFGIKNIGVIHNAQKLKTPGTTQKGILKRLDHVLVLSDFIKDKCPLKNSHVFYPISELKEKKQKDTILTIGIVGGVEYKRRDYLFLLNFLVKYKIQLQGEVVFKIIGDSSRRDGPDLIQKIQQNNLQDFFTLFDHVLSNQELESQLASCDLILPLITPTVLNFDHYLSHKISGAYNLSYGSHIPMLMHADFKNYSEFSEAHYFYSNEEELMWQIKSLFQNRKDIESHSKLVEEKTARMREKVSETFNKILN